MAFPRLTLAQLRSLARATFAQKLKGADATLPKSNITVTADTIAALVYGLYGYADWLALQALPNTATDWGFLRRWGDLFGLTPNPAVAATGSAAFTGTTGTDVPIYTPWQDSLGNAYQTTADATLVVGATSIPSAALFGGASGNLAVGAPVTLTVAIAGVDATATVDGTGFSGGADAETAQAFGQRIADRVRNPPSGSGTVADYERWAKTVPGVTRVNVNPVGRGPGTVDVRFVMDGRAPNIVPLSADIAAVQAAITAVKPVTDDAQTFAPTLQAVNYQLKGSVVPASARAAVQAALSALHGGLEIGTGISVQGQVIPAVAAAAQLKGKFLLAPGTDLTADPTVVLTLGTVSYV
jgi:uncharacterized phage protein gp47/JayE